MSTYTVIEGNVVDQPALTYSDNGVAYAKVTVAVNSRVRQQDGSYTDGHTVFYRVTCWRARAENAANSFAKGDTVIAAGNLTVQSYTRKDGTTGISHELAADLIGASVLYRSVTPDRKAE